jgi:hypothetical protein
MAKINQKLGTVIAAMILGVQLGRAVAAEPTYEQLAGIETMLASNDVDALRSYLRLHPELLEGDTQLALLLRRFLEESSSLTTFLGYGSDRETSPPLVVEVPPPGEQPDGGDPDSGEGDPDGPSLY